MSDDLVHDLLARGGGTSLAHYASQYYDPVKAKEYYERTKQLKGQQPKTTETQREAVGYATKQIGDAKKSDIEKLQAEREAKVKATVDRIQTRLKETIRKRADAILKRLEHLPKNADPKLVAKLTQSHSKNVAKARAQARQEMQKASTDISNAFANARKAIDTKYSSAQATEESNIRANVR